MFGHIDTPLMREAPLGQRNESALRAYWKAQNDSFAGPLAAKRFGNFQANLGLQAWRYEQLSS